MHVDPHARRALGHALSADRFHIFGLDSSRSYGRFHAYEKDEAADAEAGTLSLRICGKKYVFETNSHMARQQMDFDKFIEEMPQSFAAGALRREFQLIVHGAGLLPFFAVMIGLHADPACNADPARVGGFINLIAEKCEMNHFSIDEKSPISDNAKYTVPLPCPVP
ncbi:MAG: hypothetical protein LCH56_17120 [Proteobacteria bacterium]|nr:hypothetical protein [Pseudomonadota bacterium]